MREGNAEELTSFVKRLKDEATLLGLLVSHIVLTAAAARKIVAGSIVKIVSSNRIVKSKLLVDPE